MNNASHRDRNSHQQTEGDSQSSGIVANGFENLVRGVEEVARKEVEAKYAEEWNRSSIAKRWRLQKKIDAEVAVLVSERMPDVSPDALF